MSRRKYSWPYVGLVLGGGRVVFRSVETPTWDSHGHLYGAVIGPFRTRRGAGFMSRYGAGNPHCRCVADAERLGYREELEERKRA